MRSTSSRAIQKEIKAHDILSELLQIAPQSLFKIVSVDVGAARDEINRMSGEFGNSTAQPFILAASPEIVKLTIGYLMFFKDLKHYHQVDSLINSTKISSIEFPKEAAKIKNDPIFETNCSAINYKYLSAITKRFSSDFGTIDTPNSSEMSLIFQNFSADISTVISCIDSIPQLQRQFEELKIRGLREKYETVRDARALSTRFSNFANGADFNNMINFVVLRNLRATFESRRRVWGGDVSDASRLKEILIALLQSVEHVQEYNQDYEEFDYVHTVGFYNSSDMIKVYDDLKSPWFQKYIAKGANTTNLSRAFRPFRLISQKIVALETTWDRFAESAEKELTNEVSNGLQHIINLKALAENFTASLDNVDELKRSIQKCVDLRNQNFDSSLLEVYERQEQLTRNVLDRVDHIYEHVSELQDILSKPIETKVLHAEHVKNVLKAIDRSHMFPVGWILEAMRALQEGRNAETTYQIFGSIAGLAHELEELKAASELIDEKSLKEMMGMANDLKIIDVAKCVIDTIPDEKFNRAYHTLDAFVSLLQFPSEEVVDQISRYLDTLMDVQTRIIDISNTVTTLRRKVIKNGTSSPFLGLKNSRVFSENIGICTGVLEEMDAALQNRELFAGYGEFERPVWKAIDDMGLDDWYHLDGIVTEFFDGIEKTDRTARKVRNGSLVEMASVFEQAAEVRGFYGTKAQLHELYEELIGHYNTRNSTAVKVFEVAQHLDLNFARHHSRLLNAHVTIINVQKYFDDLFGHTQHETRTITIEKHIKPAVSWQVILFVCIGFVIAALMIVLFVYGMTEKGRAHYKNLYIYYFGRHEHFEKRWRYSLFMDTIDEKNALLDAVREGNKPNLLKALKNGAYIDAYNKFGNTALHVATKYALPDHVELLITYGANRSLLNHKNLLPIQMIPHDYKTRFPQRIGKFEKIKTIYKKYEKKAFKICVPQAFPDSSFHVWMDDKVDEALGDHFLEKFRAITSDEPIPTTTHVVFKTDKHGVLENDSLDALMWIFHGAIIVKEQWLTDCLNNDSLIRRDMDYLIEKVKYKGVTYDCVLQWSEAMAKAKMPYLLGVFVAVVAPDVKNLFALSNIVTTQGGVFLNVFPLKDHFNKGSRPYLHAHLGPLFLIHDGTQDLTIYKNDPDKMYTLFTEEEFVIFMLKRETNRDTRPNPPTVMIGDEF